MWSRIFKKNKVTGRRGKVDLWLLGATLALVVFGTVMIYSSSSVLALEKFKDGEFFIKRQLTFLVMGFVIMFIMTKIDYRLLAKLAYPILALSVVFLMALFIPGLGIRAGGATRWLKIAGFSFQVVELVKVALVIFLACHLARHSRHLTRFGYPFLFPLGVMALLGFLTFFQPDYGSTLLLAAITVTLLYLAGISYRQIFALAAVLIPLAVAGLLAKGYRVARLTSYLDPWQDPLRSGFQIIQSFISFGSGGATGVGLGGGVQKLFYLPEAHTDFILAVIAEESGLIGVMAVIILYTVLISRGFVIAYRTEDFFGYLLAAGLTLILALGVTINVFGVMGLIPLKGMALPFLSYGGTSLLMSLFAVGVLLNISRQCPQSKTG
jgi:cell division protein FtsW